MIQEWEQPLTGQDTSYQLHSNYEKRSLQNRVSDPQCMILRQTLAELYSIIKEEAEVLEECIEKAHTDNKRPEKRRGTDDCSLYRETLTELFEIVKEEARNYDECLEREGRNKKALFLL